MAEMMRATVEKAIANTKRHTTFGQRTAQQQSLAVILGTPEETAEIVTYLLAMCQALEEVTLGLADRIDAIQGDKESAV
jgi:hypothetical protein